jgi:hypothetical protein
VLTTGPRLTVAVLMVPAALLTATGGARFCHNMAREIMANPNSTAIPKPFESSLLAWLGLVSGRCGPGNLVEVLGAGELLIGTFLA